MNAHLPFWTARVAALALLAFTIPSTQAGEVRAIVYFHGPMEHYFMSADAAEIAALDATAPLAYTQGSGWTRTGLRLRVSDTAESGAVPVCRFYTDAFGGKLSHFFTASAAECAALKSAPASGWVYEGIAFHAWLASAQGCSDGFAAVTRYYNNGRGGAPNHAYTTDAAHGQRLLAAGFVAEGIAYCVPTSASESATRSSAIAGTTLELPKIPEVYGPGGPSAFVFETTVRTTNAWKLVEAGLPHVMPWVYQSFNDAWTSETGWDPLSNAYALVGGSGFEGDPIRHIAYVFDRVDAAGAPVCAHVVWKNLHHSRANQIHPLQDTLWSACQPGQLRTLP